MTLHQEQREKLRELKEHLKAAGRKNEKLKKENERLEDQITRTQIMYEEKPCYKHNFGRCEPYSLCPTTNWKKCYWGRKYLKRTLKNTKLKLRWFY